MTDEKRILELVADAAEKAWRYSKAVGQQHTGMEHFSDLTREAARSAGGGAVPEREAAWLVERKVSPPQYITENSPYPDLSSDPWRAARFKTEREAFDFRLRLASTSLRDECQVVEHVFINKSAAPAPADTTARGCMHVLVPTYGGELRCSSCGQYFPGPSRPARAAGDGAEKSAEGRQGHPAGALSSTDLTLGGCDLRDGHVATDNPSPSPVPLPTPDAAQGKPLDGYAIFSLPSNTDRAVEHAVRFPRAGRVATDGKKYVLVEAMEGDADTLDLIRRLREHADIQDEETARRDPTSKGPVTITIEMREAAAMLDSLMWGNIEFRQALAGRRVGTEGDAK